MIEYIEVSNDRGVETTLYLRTPELSGFIIADISGLTPIRADVNQARVSGGDGTIINSIRRSYRNIVLTLIYTDNVDISLIRQESYKIFPFNSKIQLHIYTDKKVVTIEGYVESNEINMFSQQQASTVSIICPQPYFVSMDNNGLTSTTFHGVDSLFEFPVSNESLTNKLINFGELRSEVIKTIHYDGDENTGIYIEMSFIGPVDNISIINIDSRDVMHIDTDAIASITGSGVDVGDSLYIDTTFGNKSVKLFRDGIYYNVLNAVNDDVWFEIVPGDNTFAYTAEDGTENMLFSIYHKVLYGGI